MKKAVLLLILLVSISGLKAQTYDNAIGLRGGLHSGLTYKHFISNTKAIEGILHTRWGGWEIVGLMEHHNDIPDVNGLYWFYGYGAHIGFYDAANTGWYDDGNSYTVVGVDGIIGLEYQIPGAPLTLGLDWKPYFNLTGYSHFFGDGGALSLRFTF